jgi:hypothetical protein
MERLLPIFGEDPEALTEEERALRDAALLAMATRRPVTASTSVFMSQPMYPIIASTADVEPAIALAEAQPEVRWYVEKRVRAFNPDAQFPWSDHA